MQELSCLHLQAMSPSKTDCAVAGAAAAVVAPAAVKTGALVAAKAVGFGAAGPVAKSYAASWMAATAVANGGGVAAGSTYAGVQSFAMTAGLFSPVAAAVGIGAAAYFGIRWYRNK